ncbi:kinase-like domain-containing protein [Phycomyces nitens]|nr:kinase-like domain-containing protein [Phycomyces nitens]
MILNITTPLSMPQNLCSLPSPDPRETTVDLLCDTPIQSIPSHVSSSPRHIPDMNIPKISTSITQHDLSSPPLSGNCLDRFEMLFHNDRLLSPYNPQAAFDVNKDMAPRLPDSPPNSESSVSHFTRFPISNHSSDLSPSTKVTTPVSIKSHSSTPDLFPSSELHQHQNQSETQAILTTREDCRIILSNNPAINVLLGNSADRSLTGMSMLDFVHPMFRAQFKDLFNKRKHPDADIEYSLLISGSVLPIIKHNQSPSTVSLWLKEKQSSSGEKIYIWIFEEIFEVLVHVSVDSKGLILHVDEAVLGLYGYTSEELVGRPLNDLIPTWSHDFETVKTSAEWESIGSKTKKGAMFPVSIKLLEKAKTPLSEKPLFNFRISSTPMIAGLIEIEDNGIIESCNQTFVKYLFGRSADSLVHKVNIEKLFPQFPKLYKHAKRDSLLQSDVLLNNTAFRKLVVDSPPLDGTEHQLASRDGENMPVMLVKHNDGSLFEVKVQLKPIKDTNRLGLWISFDMQDTFVRHGHAWNESSDLEIKSQDGLGLPALKASHEPSLPSSEAQSGSGSSLSSGLDSTPKVTMTTPVTEKASIAPPSINDYTVLNILGEGAYGVVWLAVHKDRPDEKVVIKYVTKSNILVDCWTRDRALGAVPVEIHILNTLRKIPHTNCGSMLDFFEDDDYCYIVMPLHGSGMDLFDYIELNNAMDENSRHIFKQIAMAVQHLHHNKIVHRDIKDENIVLDENNHVWLIDFGSAAYVKPNRSFETFVGTLDYAAPEILRGETYEGPPQDVWALGILLYTLVHRENPFYDMDEIMAKELRIAPDACPVVTDLIRKMLNRDIKERISIDQVLEHAWLQN